MFATRVRPVADGSFGVSETWRHDRDGGRRANSLGELKIPLRPRSPIAATLVRDILVANLSRAAAVA